METFNLLWCITSLEFYFMLEIQCILITDWLTKYKLLHSALDPTTKPKLAGLKKVKSTCRHIYQKKVNWEMLFSCKKTLYVKRACLKPKFERRLLESGIVHYCGNTTRKRSVLINILKPTAGTSIISSFHTKKWPLMSVNHQLVTVDFKQWLEKKWICSQILNF